MVQERGMVEDDRREGERDTSGNRGSRGQKNMSDVKTLSRLGNIQDLPNDRSCTIAK